MTTKDKEELVHRLAAQLGEHFDVVQIMTSWNEEGITRSINSGIGNWYARQGMAHQFIVSDQNQDAAEQLSKRIIPPDDDGDRWKLNQP